MLIRRPPDLPASAITPQDIYIRRREFIAAGTALLLSTPAAAAAQAAPASRSLPFPRVVRSPHSTDEKQTPFDTLTTYNNFYEFGPDKDSPARNAHRLRLRPWTVTVEGEVKTPRTFAIEDILKWAPLEERVYRLRCVEGWSAVVPWVGFPVSELIKRVQPTGNARFVEFQTLADPEQMPHVRVPLLDWPYREALRLDEAMHPLAILAVGLYGEPLPRPNGAPIRLVVPWKYGFKSAKSIVRVRFVEKEPVTTWMKASPEEYGFYSNVNPEVPHRRWSQSHERRLGEFFKRKTLPFNGYAEQVASLYAGMDLKQNF